MTTVQAQPRVLNAADAPAVRRLVAADPIANCVVDGRLHEVPDLDPHRLGGFLWGLDGPHAADGTGSTLRAAVFHGGNLVPIGTDQAALHVLGEQLARTGRGCSSIVGPIVGVQTLWRLLSPWWGPARAVRARQPLLCSSQPAAMPADPAVRPVRTTELDRYLPAAVAMFTEELDISPLGRDAGRGYRNRVGELIAGGRAFARFDERGRVMFKAEIGALSPSTAQVQGVWVRPDLRGQGLGTAGMAAVLALALRHAPTVSLYVNDYNAAARAMYARLGLRQVNLLQTVLF